MNFKTSHSLNKPATASSSYHDQMFAQWQADPNSVDKSWQEYFSNPTGAAGLNELL